MYTFSNLRLTFTWPPDELKPAQNVLELTEGMRDAARRSVENPGQTFTVHLPYMDQQGAIEARTNSNYRLPSRQYTHNFKLLSSYPYLVVKSPVDSIYFRLEIPGLCHLVRPNLLAVSLEAAPYINEIVAEVFNYSSVVIAPEVGSADDVRYYALPSTNSMLSKKPKVPKITDFTPIFTQLFGEKIATVIMKEINK